MTNEDDLLNEFPPGLDWPADHPATADDDTFYACEVGTALWEAYRLTHPEEPVRPPDICELPLNPGADAFYTH